MQRWKMGFLWGFLMYIIAHTLDNGFLTKCDKYKDSADLEDLILAIIFFVAFVIIFCIGLYVEPFSEHKVGIIIGMVIGLITGSSHFIFTSITKQKSAEIKQNEQENRNKQYRTLIQLVGKSFFIDYYYQLKDSTLCDMLDNNLIDYIDEETATRLAYGQQIFISGLEKIALNDIANTNNIDEHIKQKARDILDKENSDLKKANNTVEQTKQKNSENSNTKKIGDTELITVQKKHYWTYEENKYCCQFYVVIFIIKKTNVTDIGLKTIIDEIHNKLPDISNQSILEKLKNTKQICLDLKVKDSFNFSPLPDYSLDNMKALKEVLNNYGIKFYE